MSRLLASSDLERRRLHLAQIAGDPLRADRELLPAVRAYLLALGAA